MHDKILVFEQSDEDEQMVIYFLKCSDKKPARLLSLKLPQKISGESQKFFKSKVAKSIGKSFKLQDNEEEHQNMKKLMQDLGEIQETDENEKKKLTKKRK